MKVAAYYGLDGARFTSKRLIERALPFTFLSAVVMQELTAGARTLAQARELERSLVTNDGDFDRFAPDEGLASCPSVS